MRSQKMSQENQTQAPKKEEVPQQQKQKLEDLTVEERLLALEASLPVLHNSILTQTNNMINVVCACLGMAIADSDKGPSYKILEPERQGSGILPKILKDLNDLKDTIEGKPKIIRPI